MNPQSRIVVIGAGISGLCAAYMLKKKGFSVQVLERNAFPGGTIQSRQDNGWLIEIGPNSTLETSPLFSEIFSELHLTEQLVYAHDASSKRYIVRNGKLHDLPMKPGVFISSRLWTLGGKLRLLKEPFIGRARKEESIAEFVTRRLGQEFLDYAINPFVAGVYAGDPKQLSVQSAFPKLYALEEKYGGLIKGMIGSRKERKARKEVAKDRAKMFSFRNGMQTLPLALSQTLAEDIIFSCTVERVIPMRAGRFPVYTVTYTRDGVRETTEAQAVVLATPAYAAAEMIRPIDPEMARTLESIYYPPVAEVFLGFKKNQINRPLDGFGFLVPEVEHKNILGTIWSSSLFPDRAPEGHVALTTFVGGARNPDLITNNDERLTALVLSDLQPLMNISGQPVYTHISRWQKAIPQYNLGYYKILQAIEHFEQNFRGAFICSNYRGGIAVGDCVMNAEKIQERIIDYLAL